MKRLSLVFVWGLAACGMSALAPCAAGGQTPADNRLGDFAQQIYYPVGSKRLTIVGDSINTTNATNRMSAGYRDTWHVPWNGWVVHADNGAADMGYMNGQNLWGNDYTQVWDPGDSFGGGQISVNPVRTREINYTHRPWLGMLISDCMLLSSSTSRFPAGDYFSSGHVTARLVLFQDANTLPELKIRGMRGSAVVKESTRFSAIRPLHRIVGVDVDLGSGAGAPRVQVCAPDTGVSPGNIWDFWRVDLMGVLYRNSVVNGVQMSCISHGGWRTVDHAQEFKFTDKALREYYTQIGAPTHLILWLGQNQTTPEASQLAAGVNTAFKNNLKAVMARHNRIISELGAPAPRWLLVPQYKTGYSAAVHELMAQTMYEISVEDPQVSFFNLYAASGGQSFNTALYTFDGIHPTLAGSVYLAGLMDSAMRASVRCTADVDASGFVDGEDFDTFMRWFEDADPAADIDRSGFIDLEDRDLFIAAYEGGC